MLAESWLASLDSALNMLHTYWAERSDCDQRSNFGRPLFLVINLLTLTLTLTLTLATVTKFPEGVVVGFQIFAWAPK